MQLQKTKPRRSPHPTPPQRQAMYTQPTYTPPTFDRGTPLGISSADHFNNGMDLQQNERLAYPHRRWWNRITKRVPGRLILCGVLLFVVVVYGFGSLVQSRLASKKVGRIHKLGKSIAVIGSGPAGISAAYHVNKLAREQKIPVSITVFEGKDVFRLANGCYEVNLMTIENPLPKLVRFG